MDSFHEERFTIGKLPRQCGKTQTCAAYILWAAIFNQDYSIGILANKEKTATEILTRVKNSYELLPLWLQQGIVEWNKKSVELENGSRIITSGTSASAIRGSSINLIFLDEYAFIPQSIADEFYESIYPVISSGKTTKLIILSTPKGMNHFYKMWQESVNGKNDFNPVTIHWSETPRT